MNPPRQQRPHFGIASYERVDLVRAQLISQLAQLPKRFTRPLLKTQPQIFVGEQPANHELNRLLGHADGRSQSARQRLLSRSFQGHASNAGPCVCMDAQAARRCAANHAERLCEWLTQFTEPAESTV